MATCGLSKPALGVRLTSLALPWERLKYLGVVQYHMVEYKDTDEYKYQLIDEDGNAVMGSAVPIDTIDEQSGLVAHLEEIHGPLTYVEP